MFVWLASARAICIRSRRMENIRQNASTAAMNTNQTGRVIAAANNAKYQ